jgi:MerR family transcriptional regulator/heat shock protein HspR
MSKKPLYSISVVSEMLDLHPQTIRQYERMGLVKPQRTEGNTRLYSDEDIERLKLIITLTKDLGVNIAGVDIIINMKEQIEELQNTINELLVFIKSNINDLSHLEEEENEKAIVPVNNKRGIIKINIEKDV